MSPEVLPTALIVGPVPATGVSCGRATGLGLGKRTADAAAFAGPSLTPAMERA